MNENDKIKKNNSESTFLGARVSALIEIVCFFFILFIIALIFGMEYNFFTASPHPFWILVVLISAQYGTIEGLLAALAATAIFLLGDLPPRNILQDKSEYFFFIGKTPILWFITAVILGELRMKHIRARDQLKKAALQAAEKETKIKEAYTALKKIKERLEMRVASEMQTSLMVISAFKELEELGKEGVIKGACDLTKALVAPDKFSIFLLESRELKLVAFWGWEPSDQYLESFGPDTPLFQEIVGKKRTISADSFDSFILGKEGVLVAPIVADNAAAQVLGMIKVEQIPFLRLRTATIESLRTIGTWVGKAYANVLAHMDEK